MVIGSRHEKLQLFQLILVRASIFLANHVNGGVPMVFNDLDWHGHAHSGIG
jgi:hypothetical protein